MTIKTIDSTTLRDNLSETLKSVNAGQTVVVKKRGQSQVAIIDIDAYEDLLASQNPEYLKSIAEARASKERYTPEEVFGDLWD